MTDGTNDGVSRELESHGRESGKLYTHIGLAGSGSREESWEPNSSDGAGRELNADLLVAVFAHLPQKQLFEVMLVSRDWKEAAIEGSGLWRMVDVFPKYHWGPVWMGGMGGMEGMDVMKGMKGVKGRGLEVLHEVLRVAEGVRITNTFFEFNPIQMLSVGGVLGPNLRCLTLPARSVSPSFLQLLLANCRNLKSLVVEGDLDDGILSLQICHPTLEILRFDTNLHPFFLIVDCPALLHLHFGVDVYELPTDEAFTALRAPSLNCPRLTSSV